MLKLSLRTYEWEFFVVLLTFVYTSEFIHSVIRFKNNLNNLVYTDQIRLFQKQNKWRACDFKL